MGFLNGHLTTDSGATVSSGIDAGFAENGFQNFVATDYLLAINGIPGASQFRSDITGRGPVVNLSNDLLPRFGINRIMTANLSLIPTEFGPSSQPVYRAINDKKEQMRFVGAWVTFNNTNGQFVESTNQNDYVEVVFYGTGLNLLGFIASGAVNSDYRVSVDGGAEGSNVFPTGTLSSVLAARTYNENAIIPIVSGLTLGVHTVKIRQQNVAGVGFPINCYGFEILNEATTLKVPTGKAYIEGTEVEHSALESLAYNSTFESGALGTRGGRVVVSLKNDGTIAKCVTPVNGAAAYLSSADHTNEEVARNYHPREFGVNRADDFSTLGSSNSIRAFTLSDGTTSLQSDACAFNLGNTNALFPVTNGSKVTFTFVGCGVDLKIQDNASGGSDTFAVWVDGVNVGNLSTTGDQTVRIQKVASGLPYGTHTVSLQRVTASTFNRTIHNFIVYQPKKPTAPADSVELADYNVMANYAQSSTTGVGIVGTGVLRKASTREFIYVGSSWSAVVDAPSATGIEVQTSNTGDYAEYTFFGTGFEIKTQGTPSATANVTVDGASNLSAFTTFAVGSSITFTAATGAVSVAGPGGSAGADFAFGVSGLTLGRHTVRITRSGGANSFAINAIDIITPIHSHKNGTPGSVMNNLPVGSQAIGDTRKDTALKGNQTTDKYRGVAYAISSGNTTSGTDYVPLPDLSLVVPSNGGWFTAMGMITGNGPSGGNAGYLAIAVNGTVIPGSEMADSTNATVHPISTAKVPFYLAPGVHKIDVYWKVSGGTFSVYSNFKSLTVEEL